MKEALNHFQDIFLVLPLGYTLRQETKRFFNKKIPMIYNI